MKYLGLMWANLFRRRVRTILTLLSVLVAFLLFTILRTVVVLFDSGVDFAGVDRLITGAKYSVIELLPIRQRDQILSVDGVSKVTHSTWFGGVYQDRRNFFAIFPVEPEQYFDVRDDFVIDPARLDAFERTRTGAVVSPQMMEKYGWEIGDKIPIQADIYPMRDGNMLWEFDLVGSYRLRNLDTDPQTMLIHYDYFDEARSFGQGAIGWFTVKIDDPDRGAEIASTIDGLFENSLDPTKTATEAEFQKSFASQIGDIGLMMTGILSAVFFTILLLTGNTMTQALKERIRELAVLKTLGFTDAAVSMIVLGESVLLCFVGGALGIGASLLFTPIVRPQMEQFLGVFELSPETMLLALAVAMLLGLVVGAVPALTARRLKIVDALRRG